MITDKEVDHITKLARLELDDKTKDRIKTDLSSILGYIDRLNSVDTAGVEPLYQVTGLQNNARPDERRADFELDRTTDKLLVDQAPHNEGRYVKFKSVKH